MIGYKLIPGKRWIETQERLDKLNVEITSATEFVREIERGNLDVSIGANAAGSELKTSLVNMRDQMKKYSLTEKQRNWVNEGLAEFVQILRSGNNEGRSKLSDRIIRKLVVYLNANQGALLSLNDDDPNDSFLETEACYAYDRKKFLQRHIPLGDGLAGQVVLEKSTLHMTDVPKDFVKITSGLGEALPRNILLVPLKLDERVYGVVEIASFQIFQPYEIDFVERLGESIASTIAAVKNSERTSTLLKETQLQAEQMKAQEEEVRQNLEELSATQEAMQRAMKEVETKEAYISQILNTSQDIIYTVDSDFRMATWNTAFAREAEQLGLRIEKGMNAFEWSPDDRRKLMELYKRVLNGETFEITYESVMNGKRYHFLSVYAPIKSPDGVVIEAGVYARNVTPMVEAQQDSARHLRESQQQAEELKAQEEELRQNMEELSATQEAMQRAIADLEVKEAYASEMLNATHDLIYTVDRNFRLITWNRAFGAAAIEMKVSLEKGMNAFEWWSHYRQALIPLWTRALNGETFQHQWESEREGGKDHYLSFYAPVRSGSGEIFEVVVFGKNIALLVEAQRESARLLSEAQQQAEELKAQEEELRQNMEELSATQETMERASQEAKHREEYISHLLNASQAVVFTVDLDFNLVTWNEGFEKTLAGLGVRPEKGMIAFGWRPENERQQFVELFKRVFKGETFETRNDSKFDGTIHHFHSTYAPIKGKNYEIVEAAVFAKDITTIIQGTKTMEGSDHLTPDASENGKQMNTASKHLTMEHKPNEHPTHNLSRKKSENSDDISKTS